MISVLPGKNNGKGYYIYEKGSKPKPDPSIQPIIEESRRLSNIMPNGKVVLFGSVMLANSTTPIYVNIALKLTYLLSMCWFNLKFPLSQYMENRYLSVTE